MTDTSSSITFFVPSRTPTILIEIDSPNNLVLLNVSAQALLKLITTNYSTWWLQFTSLLFGYNLIGFIDGSKRCPPLMITLPDAASPSPNPNYTLRLRQDQLLLNAIIGSASPNLVQFLSTSTISKAVWTTLEKTYASPSYGQNMVHSKILANPQQGT